MYAGIHLNNATRSARKMYRQVRFTRHSSGRAQISEYGRPSLCKTRHLPVFDFPEAGCRCMKSESNSCWLRWLETWATHGREEQLAWKMSWAEHSQNTRLIFSIVWVERQDQGRNLPTLLNHLSRETPLRAVTVQAHLLYQHGNLAQPNHYPGLTAKINLIARPNKGQADRPVRPSSVSLQQVY